MSKQSKTTKPAPKSRKAQPAAKKSAPARKAQAATPRVEQTAGAPNAALSKAVAKTWKDPAVAKARTTRHGVRIGNKHYSSMGQAFVDQGWSLGRMQRVRLAVKREGRAEFEGKVITLVKE